MSIGTIGLKTKSKFNPSWSGGASTVAEVGSIQLEWQYLSRVTGNPVYAQKVDHITGMLHC
jgi:mannosyl-oligosaccharide alpha-1,2-mannosidase